MPNAFTQASRDDRLHLGLEGFIDKLRAPEALAALVTRAKPVTMPNSDFALKSMLDQYLMGCIVRGDYREVHGTLVTVFGPDVTTVPRPRWLWSRAEDGTTGAQAHARNGGLR
jgi:hypothetical protein